MKKILSILLCLILLLSAVSVSAVAAAVDPAATGDNDVYIDIYLDADAEEPVVSAQYTYGDVPVRPEDPGREGLTFIDWYTTPTFVSRFDFSKRLYEDAAIYARFVPEGQEIGVNVFDSPDAEYPTYGYLCAKGDLADVPKTPAYDEDNYVLLGWYSDRELTQEVDFSQPIYDYLYLFPRIEAWEDVCFADLYLDPDAQYPTASAMFVRGECCPQPADPGKEDMTFEGWYFDRALTQPIDFSKPMYEDFEMFPKFVPIHYHDLKLVPAIPATATTDGRKAHMECSGCGKWFEPTPTALIEITDRESLIIPAKGPYLLGDADGSDDVDSTDATKIQRYLASIPFTGGFCRGASNVDGDDEISVIDVTFIMRYNVSMITPYAIGEPVSPLLG